MTHVETIEHGTALTFKVSMTGGHNRILYNGVEEEDSVAKIEYFKTHYLEKNKSPYNIIMIFNDFLVSGKFLSTIIALILDSKKKLLQNALIVVKKTPTKIMAYQIVKRYLPSLRIFESEDLAMRYIIMNTK